ncbi:hypothetical protein [Psychroflexus sp. ALD_RP9]|uniref:hypothetical protein n=1 Tax=Psychroflexus sp. ALD_RP9 TaxID=2777186 RepID=UPI001A8EE545|nr:hypothetical protein [Psychroflexus sp. ALD_RP9]QSS96648.1 hypothetical protein IMZ30_09365 [Psychroflexus sp. ALD_RP9]
METNFEIEENYAVQLNGTHIDLHNNFDFIGITKNRNNITLDFKKTKGDWVKNDEFENINFEFKNISYEYYEEGDSKAQKEDSERLGEITFFPSNSREMNDGIIPQSKPKKDDDLIMFFEDGKVIRIGCDEIELTVEK